MSLRVAVDANVLIAGNTWPRWPYEVLLHALQDDYALILSPLVIAEARHQIHRNFPQSIERFEHFLQVVEYELAPAPSQEDIQAHPDLVRQIEDIPIALSIRDAKVDYFVTYDKDFTEDHESTAKVREAIPGIILPPLFLREAMGWSSEKLEVIRRRNWSDIQDN